MSLQLHFAELLPGARMVRPDAFRLYEVDGHYPLPNLLLRTVADIDSIALQSLHVHAVESAPGELEHWLKNEWLPNLRPVDRVTASAEVASGVAVPTFVVDQSLPAGASEATSRGRVVVTWNLAFTDPTGGVGDDLVHVVLDFAPVGVPVPPPEPAPETWTWRALRHRGAEPSLKTFAAIDFGTSSSTVTLYDSRKPDPYLIDPEQARKLRSLLAELLKEAPPPDTPAAAEWELTLRQLQSSLATRFPQHNLSTVDAVVDALRADSASTDLLHAVCAELDQALAGELSEWLATRLHHSYDTAFQVPALTSLRLRPVLFDKDNYLYDTPSVLMVKPDPLEARLLENQRSEDDQSGEPIRDLKRRFAGREPDSLPGLRDPDGGEVTIDHLVAHVYELLASETEQFAHDPEKQKVDRLPRLVVTYPTTTTPSNRARLADLIKQSLDLKEVITKYDEGVAAGLYFLMRDFGGHQALGVESLRANSRRVVQSDRADDEPSRWRQIMLVIDIGGGTTDIALIGLTLTDLTPDLPKVDPAVKGRYYRIEPEVLGSAGHPLLGGDYLTLRVFYWLKAAIIDALVTGDPKDPARAKLIESLPPRLRPDPKRPGLLTQLVVSGDADEPAPAELAHELRSKLNTQWRADDPKDWQAAFWLLWPHAEEAKKVLGRGRPYVMPTTAAKIFVEKVVDDATADLIPDEGVTLQPQSFTQLTRPAVAMAIDFAAHLVKSRLAKLPDARLDRVMLSGKTSLMPLVKEEAASWLTDLVAERPDGWRSRAVPTVEVDERYAKEAAALGACWAQSVVQHGAPRPDVAEVAAGRTVVSISVDNLFTALPSNFYRNIGDGRFIVLEIGTSFTELDGMGSLGVRAKDWVPLPRTYELQRELGPKMMIRWGHFTFVDHAQGFSYNHAVWGGDQGIVPTMMALLEVDQACMPKLYLCNNGQPHFVARSRSLNLLSALRRHSHRQYVDEAEGRLIDLPTLVVRTGRGGGNDPIQEETVLSSWDTAKAELAFPLFVHASDDPDSSAVPGVILPLPPASHQHGGYTFVAVLPDRTEIDLGELPVPGKWGPRARYSVTLTVDGQLRVHRGELPFLTATSMAEVEKREGTVLTVRMEEDHTPLNPSWRPFNGKH
ncbi:MAG: hypothetical protein ACRDUV_00625 [Pseudonocardiaceae bacterium]